MKNADVVVVGGAGHFRLPFANVLAAQRLLLTAYDAKPIVDIWNLFATGELFISKRGLF